jgi:hypothetical protein
MPAIQTLSSSRTPRGNRGNPLDVACYTPEKFEEGQDGFLPGVIEKGISIQ